MNLELHKTFSKRQSPPSKKRTEQPGYGFVFEFRRNLKTKRARETRPRSHIGDGFREGQSKMTEWQNLYAQRTIMGLGMGLSSVRLLFRRLADILELQRGI
jgi:hypothetical protein